MVQSDKYLRNLNYIFDLHFKLKEKFKTIHSQLFSNIYQCKVNIILPNGILCMPARNNMFMFNFLSLI